MKNIQKKTYSISNVDLIFVKKNFDLQQMQNSKEIESIIDKSDLLISCHGAVSHVATAKNIKQIDIIDETKINFYKKWTDHFRNYRFICRKNFNDLSKEIISLL